MSTRPRLITFGISHYCEKARWALDWHGIDYREECWAPGVHMFLGKRAGANASALPILIMDGGLVQGSNEIVDWAGANGGGPPLEHPDAASIEGRADAGLGIHLRLFIYSICLPNSPESVRPALYHNLSAPQRIIGRATWPAIRKLMIKGFGIRPNSADHAKAKFETELDWLDGLLADGRPYLAGDRFSRADMTVAALLSPITRPPQMAVYRSLDLPEQVETALNTWMERPSAKWASALYDSQRDQSPGG